jgi:uncharacterized membrane protein YjjP (DUF1212 family)
MSKKDFDKGIEYESKRHDKFFHLFMGYACIAFAFIMIFSPNFKFWSSFFLCIFGGLALWLAYHESKELRRIK